MTLNILYLGEDSVGSTSLHRAAALRRLGCHVEIVNPLSFFSNMLANRLLRWLHFRTGYVMFQLSVSKVLSEIKPASPPDMIWVNGGELLGPRCLRTLRRFGCPIILYNNDDVTGVRDRGRFGAVRRALKYYDHCFVPRQSNVSEYSGLGAAKTHRIWMSYDEIEHAPPTLSSAASTETMLDVAFIGTWMQNENREEVILRLVDSGIKVSIWGNRWERCEHWPALREFHHGSALYGREYTTKLSRAKISLGLLSKGNRDLHTRRSVEVPYAGGLLCAERTSEHEQMYKNWEEAVFWSDAEECARVCKKLLNDDELRERIRLAGMRRVRELKVGNEDVCQQILDTVFKNGSN